MSVLRKKALVSSCFVWFRLARQDASPEKRIKFCQHFTVERATLALPASEAETFPFKNLMVQSCCLQNWINFFDPNSRVQDLSSLHFNAVLFCRPTVANMIVYLMATKTIEFWALSQFLRWLVKNGPWKPVFRSRSRALKLAQTPKKCFSGWQTNAVNYARTWL